MGISRGEGTQDRLIAQERLAQDNQAHELAQAAFLAVEFSENLIDAGAVADFEFTSQGVGHQFFAQAAVELVLSIYEEFSEFRKRPKRISAREFAGGIDRIFLLVFVPPASDGVEVFQREAERVDLAMAFGAGCDFPMFQELLANGDSAADVRFDRSNVGWRGRWRVAQ